MKKYTREEIKRLVDRIMIDKLGIVEEEIRDDAVLSKDLGADSLDCVDLVMACEREFCIIVPDDEYYNVAQMNIGQLYDLVERLQG